jgi:hypothetical protein
VRHLGVERRQACRVAVLGLGQDLQQVAVEDSFLKVFLKVPQGGVGVL